MPRSRQSRTPRADRSPLPEGPIPDKLYFRIGEVSELTQTKTYVLRYWETEFPTLKPVKSRTGHRLYRREDVEAVLTIKRLLYEEGFTIAGARKQLESPNGSTAESPAAPMAHSAPLHPSESPVSRRQLVEVRDELARLLTLLSRR